MAWFAVGAVASTNPTKVMVQLEQTDGGKYNSVLDIPGMAKGSDQVVDLEMLKRGDDSKDPGTKANLGLVKQLGRSSVGSPTAGRFTKTERRLRARQPGLSFATIIRVSGPDLDRNQPRGTTGVLPTGRAKSRLK